MGAENERAFTQPCKDDSMYEETAECSCCSAT